VNPDEKLQARIKKRCLALAKDLIKGKLMTHREEDLLKCLVQKAFFDLDKAKAARQAYGFLVANKISDQSAWEMSGMSALVSAHNPQGPA